MPHPFAQIVDVPLRADQVAALLDLATDAFKAAPDRSSHDWWAGIRHQLVYSLPVECRELLVEDISSTTIPS